MRRRYTPILTALGAMVAALAGAASAQQQAPSSLTLYEQPDYRGASVTFYADNANIGSTGFTTRARSAQVHGVWRLCEGGGYRDRCEVLNDNVRDLNAYELAGRVGSAQLVAGPGPSAAASGRPARSALPPAPYARPDPHAEPGPDSAGRYARPGPTDFPTATPPAPDRRYEGDGRYDSAPGPRVYGRDYREELYPPAVDAPATPDRPPTYPAAADRGVEGRSTIFFARPSLRGQDVSARDQRDADAFCRAQGLGAAVYFDQGRRSGRASDTDGRPMGGGPVLSDVLCRK